MDALYRNILKKVKVLYVEDEEYVREQTVTLLSHFFDFIDTSENGKEGLKKFIKNSYDLVISDISMPIMDGLKMSEEIKKLDDSTIIIILSAYNDKEHLQNAIDSGIDGFLKKPLEISSIVKLFEKIAKQIKVMKENKAYKKQLEKMVKNKTEEIIRLNYQDKLSGLCNYFKLVSILDEKEKSLSPISYKVNNPKNNSFYEDNEGYFESETIVDKNDVPLEQYEKEYEKYEDLFKPKKEELEELKVIEENLKKKKELLNLKEKELEEKLYYLKEKSLEKDFSLDKLDSAIKKIELLKKENDLLKKQLSHLKNVISSFKEKFEREHEENVKETNHINKIFLEEYLDDLFSEKTPERIKRLEEEKIFKPRFSGENSKKLEEEFLKKKLYEEKNLTEEIKKEVEEENKSSDDVNVDTAVNNESSNNKEKEEKIKEEKKESSVEEYLDLMQKKIEKKSYEEALNYLYKAKKELLKLNKSKNKKNLSSIEKVKNQMLEYELKTLEEDIKILMLKNS